MSPTMSEPEGDRPDQIDKLLNKLNSISDDLELAKIQGQQGQAKALLADGLARSCQLLRRLQGIDLLQSVTPSQTIKNLAGKREQIEKFLHVEEALLKQTKLDPTVTSYLLGKLQSLLNSGADLPLDWKEDLNLLAGLVCPEAEKAAAASWMPSLVKRAIVAGGGGLIMLLNLLPPRGIVVPAEVSTLSTSAGTWLISEAFRDRLKSFFGD